MINYKTFNPVRPITFKGKVLVSIIRLAYHIRGFLGLPAWQSIWPDHHEDPIKMNFPQQLYLGYKYYFKAMVSPEENSGMEAYFKNQDIKFTLPQGFVPQAEITLSAGGDLIPYTCITPQNTRELWDEVGDYYFGSDLVLANLETVADMSRPFSAAPEVMLNDMYFNIDQKTFDIFNGNQKYRGFDVLSTANNHTMDQGENGITATIDFLKAQKIAHTGTAASGEERDDFPILERQGIKIAFLSYTFSLNKESLPEDKPWLCNHILLNEKDPDLSLIVHQANLAKSRGADIVVASLHMGCAYQTYPGMHTVNNMHNICNLAPVDLLIGGHPHNMQPIELYTSTNAASGIKREHLILYCLGDFIAYDIYKWCHFPLIAKLFIAKGTIDGRPHVQISNLELKPLYMHRDGQKQLRLLDFMAIRANPEAFLGGKDEVTAIHELADFLDRFIITQNQAHLLSLP